MKNNKLIFNDYTDSKGYVKTVYFGDKYVGAIRQSSDSGKFFFDSAKSKFYYLEVLLNKDKINSTFDIDELINNINEVFNDMYDSIVNG